MPDAPAAGLHIPDLLRNRYGVTDPQAVFARPEAEARASGLDLDLSLQRYAYPTQAAHALIQEAGERGTQHALAVAISNAYFLEAKNISDADVLADIAEKHGFEYAEAKAIAVDPADHDLVEEAAARAAAAGVRMVPHLVFGGFATITGSRTEDEIAAAINAATDAVAPR